LNEYEISRAQIRLIGRAGFVVIKQEPIQRRPQTMMATNHHNHDGHSNDVRRKCKLA